MKDNNWSCLPKSFAMCMGVSLERMCELMGHDGSDIVWPDQPEPLCRRAFHIQEILYAIHKLNYSAMPVQLNPTITNGYGPSLAIRDRFFREAKYKLAVHMGITDTGINHAVAYIPLAGFCCPNQGFIKNFDSREIWLVNKCTG